MTGGFREGDALTKGWLLFFLCMATEAPWCYVWAAVWLFHLFSRVD